MQHATYQYTTGCFVLAWQAKKHVYIRYPRTTAAILSATLVAASTLCSLCHDVMGAQQCRQGCCIHAHQLHGAGVLGLALSVPHVVCACLDSHGFLQYKNVELQVQIWV